MIIKIHTRIAEVVFILLSGNHATQMDRCTHKHTHGQTAFLYPPIDTLRVAGDEKIFWYFTGPLILVTVLYDCALNLVSLFLRIIRKPRLTQLLYIITKHVAEYKVA